MNYFIFSNGSLLLVNQRLDVSGVYSFFFKIFFFIWAIFKVFIMFVTILPLFYGLILFGSQACRLLAPQPGIVESPVRMSLTGNLLFSWLDLYLVCITTLTELFIYLAHQLKNLLQMLLPLSWPQGCSVLYAKLILRPITFSGSLGMLGKSARCWWFWHLCILIGTHFRSNLLARDLWLFEPLLLVISWLVYLQPLAMRSP